MSKFSQEYVDFVTQSEPIQRLWKERGPRVGDWVWRNGLVGTNTSEPILQDKYYRIVFMRPNPRGGVRTYKTKDYDIDKLRWLPQLDDLLEELEKYADIDIRITECKGAKKQYQVSIPDYYEHYDDFVNEWQEQDEHGLELPTARLLERLLESEGGEK